MIAGLTSKHVAIRVAPLLAQKMANGGKALGFYSQQHFFTIKQLRPMSSLVENANNNKQNKRPKTNVYDIWNSYETEPGVRYNAQCKDRKFNASPSMQIGELTVLNGFLNGLKLSPKGKCLGWREGKEYKWWSYEQVDDRIHKVAAGLKRLGIRRQECVGIYSISRPDWVVSAYACTVRSATFVPLYDTLGADSCSYIINQAEMRLLFVDTNVAAKRIITSARSVPTLKTIVLFDEPTKELSQLAEQNSIALVSIDNFMATSGFTSKAETVDAPKPEDNFVIMYTSGTTGNPKGVILTHRAVCSYFNATDHFFDNNIIADLEFNKDNHLCLLFLPMAHIFGLLVVNGSMYRGTAVGFFGGNALKILEDAEILRPHYIPLVPRLMNRIHSIVKTDHSKGDFKSKLFWFAYRQKLKLVNRGIFTRSSIWDKLVFNETQKMLGGRTWYCSVGSAPISAEVIEFFRVVFGCFVIEGYGQTENAGVSTAAVGPVGGNVGHPIQCNAIKLVDVPDCGYFVRNGRGEICIKGTNLMSGYYKNPEKTAETIDADGWLHTGDIGEFLPDGSLKVVERKNNIFKLSQGEFVTPEKVESVYMLCQEILQIFVDGKSTEPYLVAVVVPDSAKAEKFAKKHGLDPKTSSLYKTKEFRKFILDSLLEVGKANKLNSLEQVKSVHLSSDAFTVDNEQLTPTMKNKRAQLRKRYQADIDAIYTEGPLTTDLEA